MKSSLIERAWLILRRDGFRSFWARFIGVCGYRRIYLLGRSLAEPPPPLSTRIPVVMDWMKPQDMEEYRTLMSPVKDWPRTLQLGDNNRCLTARVEGRLVAVMWACTGRAKIEYVRLDMPLASDEVYLCSAYTDPEFRGHAIAPAMSIELLRRLHDMGIRRAIRGTSPENQAALRAHAKADFHPYALVGYVGLGKWRWPFRRDLRPR